MDERACKAPAAGLAQLVDEQGMMLADLEACVERVLGMLDEGADCGAANPVSRAGVFGRLAGNNAAVMRLLEKTRTLEKMIAG